MIAISSQHHDSVFTSQDSLEYVTLDVFGEPFAGNQLAVVFEPGGLSPDQLQAITREFNFSETIFVSEGDRDGHFRARIFTPGHEIPFAGHPNIGAGVALAQIFGDGELVLSEPIGEVRITANAGEAGTGSARFAVPRIPEWLPFEGEIDDLLSVAGVDRDALHPQRAVTIAEGGVRMNMIPLRDAAAVSGARLDLARWREVLGNAWASEVYLFAEADDPSRFVVRLFAPGAGIMEDPATGSAAGVLGAFLAQERGLGEYAFSISQGHEMGRPSTLSVSAEQLADGTTRVWVEGKASVIAKGRMRKP